MSTRRKQIEKALLLYLLTENEQKGLADAIYTSMVKACQAAYQWSLKNAGLHTDWTLTESLEKSLRSLSESHAEKIASTYAEDIQKASSTFLDAYEEAQGNLDGVEQPLQDMLEEWTQKRADFKAEQVSQYETGVAANDGTTAFMQDALDGEYDEEFDEEDIDPDSMLMVGVMPESAATEDECADYAGTCMTVGEAVTELPSFPAHLLCPHYLVVFIEAA